MIDIAYSVEHPELTVIRTDLELDSVRSTLKVWIHDHMGIAEASAPIKRSTYHIVIDWDEQTHSLQAQSDTGNIGTTCKIVMFVLARLDTLTIQPPTSP